MILIKACSVFDRQSASLDIVNAGLPLTEVVGLREIYRLSRGGALYQAVSKMEKVLRQEHLSFRSRVTLSIDLMEWYGQLGWPDRAQLLARAVGEVSAATVGEYDVWTLGMRRLELLWMCLSGYEHLAEMRYRQLIKTMEKTLGRNHPQVWLTRHDSVMPNLRSGAYATAIKIYTSLIENISTACGDDNPWILHIREDLADTLSCHGEWERSTEEYSRLLGIGDVPQSKIDAIERKISLNSYCLNQVDADHHPFQFLCQKSLYRLRGEPQASSGRRSDEAGVKGVGKMGQRYYRMIQGRSCADILRSKSTFQIQVEQVGGRMSLGKMVS